MHAGVHQPQHVCLVILRVMPDIAGRPSTFGDLPCKCTSNPARRKARNFASSHRAPSRDFQSGLFGGGANPREPREAPGTVPAQAGDGARLPGRSLAPAQPGRGGGFLAGAAQTAMGVAGGIFLGSMIAGAFAGGEAQAAQAAEPAGAQGDQGVDNAADDGADLGSDDDI